MQVKTNPLWSETEGYVVLLIRYLYLNWKDLDLLKNLAIETFTSFEHIIVDGTA